MSSVDDQTLSTSARDVDWLLENFVAATSGVERAVGVVQRVGSLLTPELIIELKTDMMR